MRAHTHGTLIDSLTNAFELRFHSLSRLQADNVAQKMIYGHFTLYFKTIIMFPERIVIAENVYCNEYVQGNGTEVWNPFDETHMSEYTSGNLICDVFVTVQFMKDTGSVRSTWRSITGQMPRSMSVDASVDNLVFFPGCAAFTEYWSISPNGPDRERYRADGSNDSKSNVICMQELQLRYDPSERKYSSVTRDSGHFGPNVYAGCGDVRSGGECKFEVPFYSQIKSMSLN